MSKDNIELKNFLHLYLGCECQMVRKGKSGTKGKLFSVSEKGGCEFLGESEYWQSDQIKPILRKLDSMTEEESSEQNQLFNEAMFTESLPEAEMVKYLLSKQFDLFGLIENNLAIDKNEKQ